MESKMTPIELKSESLTSYVFPKLDEFGARVAFVEGKTELTFAGIKASAMAVSSHLTKLGVTKGDRICVYTTNFIHFSSVFLGATYSGIVVSTASAGLAARELTVQLNNCNAKVLVTTSDKLPMLADVLPNLDTPLLQVIAVDLEASTDDHKALSDVLNDDGKSATEAQITPEEDLLCLPYSSGTTGMPKGVMLTHYNVVSNIKQAFAHLAVDTSDVFVAVLPFTHIYGLVLLGIGALVVGAKTIVMSKFDPGKFLTYIQTQKVTTLHIVPPIVVFLAKHPVVAKFDLSSVKRILCGAAPLGAELAQLCKGRLAGVDILQGYGMTELSPVVCVSPANNAKLDSCGTLVPNTRAKIIDLKGNEVKQGERGELCIAGPQVMAGYFNNPTATANTIKDGWLHTGDVALADEEGYLYIVDRVKELIKYKGFQVPPAELEALLLGDNRIADVAVIGIPDEDAGELPRAYVVRAASAPELKEAEVHAFLEAQGVAHYKRLRGGVIFVAKIPKSASGKILRRVLRDQAAAAAAAE